VKIPSRSTLVAAFAGAVFTLAAGIAAAPFASSAVPGSSPVLTGWGKSKYVQGEVLVKFKPSASVQQRAASIAAQGHTLVANPSGLRWSQVKLAAGQTVEAALAAYKNDPSVEYAQPNYVYHASAAPNDTQYGQLWAFHNTGQNVVGGNFPPTSGTPGDDIHIEPAWDHVTDCSSVVVAVVDTGVNYNQEDLAGNMWDGGVSFPNHGTDFVDADSDPMDFEGHGTHVAGIIGAAGNNGVGTTGVCWKASIMAVRVLDATGSGSTTTITQGVNFAWNNGAKVINLSLGGGGFDQLFSDEISNALAHDVVVVVAAGNGDASGNSVNNDVTPTYPCNFVQPNLICVAALDQNFALASFSNFGSASVDVGAPGTNILSTFAGTAATVPDTLTTWTISGGWTHVVNNGHDFLVDPANFLVTKYGANLSDTATKGFNTSTASGVTLNFGVAVDLANSGDSFIVGVDPNGANPFSGPLTGAIPGPLDTGGAVTLLPLDISACGGKTNCLIGFELQTGPSTPGDFGIGITQFSIRTMTLATNVYQIDTGTSMATPMVAGLAAMLRAYNPNFTYADTVNAIKNAGRSIAALAGKTTTGKAIDAMSSLAYINPPTGLSAAVQ
jgi:thermitase